MADIKTGIIPALDVSMEKYKEILEQTGESKFISGYKPGFQLVLGLAMKDFGYAKNTFYNHGPGATDVPFTGTRMMETLNGHFDGVVLTPLSGPATFQKWTEEAKNNNLKVFVEPITDMETWNKNKYSLDEVGVQMMIHQGVNLGVDGFLIPYDNKLMSMVEKAGGQIVERYDDGQIQGFDEVHGFDLLQVPLLEIASLRDRYTDKPLIYDHQKTGSVSPARAEQFASINATAGIDKVIYFPHAGLALEKEAIKAAQKEGLLPIVGGMMTHEKYSQSEGGFLPEKYIMDVYMAAGDLGVVEFVVPGTKPEKIREIRESLEKKGIESVYDVPGVEKQGGQIEEIVKAAGGNVNAISGRFIYANKEMTMTQAAENLYRRMHRTR